MYKEKYAALKQKGESNAHRRAASAAREQYEAQKKAAQAGPDQNRNQGPQV